MLNYIRKQIGLFDREVPKQALALTRQKLLDALDGVGTVEQNCQRLGVDQRIRAIWFNLIQHRHGSLVECPHDIDSVRAQLILYLLRGRFFFFGIGMICVGRQVSKGIKLEKTLEVVSYLLNYRVSKEWTENKALSWFLFQTIWIFLLFNQNFIFLFFDIIFYNHTVWNETRDNIHNFTSLKHLIY